jgi:hypothetical protein
MTRKASIFDIETNGLLADATETWIVRTKDIYTREKKVWYPFRGETGWLEHLDSQDVLIGHNILRFDLEALFKLYNWYPKKGTKFVDTMILSLVMDYNRFPFGRHSLENWGMFLGNPKGEWSDFSQFHPDMDVYCEQDVDLNFDVYQFLMNEMSKIRDPEQLSKLRAYLSAEHAVSRWSAKAYRHGWPFDKEGALVLKGKLEKVVEEAEAALLPIMGLKTVIKDKEKGEVVVKEPKRAKAGCYDAKTANWFGIDPWCGFEGESNPIDGPYCRVEFEPLKLSSTDDVKRFLFRQGWVPLSWNTKRDPDSRLVVKTSPKITEDDLELLKGHGALYSEYTIASSRLSILNNWLAALDENGYLHGDSFDIGTPSMRTRHSIICNIPSPDARWGEDVRKLFKAKPGWTIIGADSAGNQARGLAHYLKSPEYVDILLNGDIHQRNADIANDIVKQMKISGIVVSRGQAKRILYAFLFGASGGKLWSYITGIVDESLGNRFKKLFMSSTPGLKELMDVLEKIYGATRKFGDGYIYGIAGNKIYVDSFHKLLVYLLQACEKATCAAAVMLTMQYLEEANIPYIPLIMYHDEEQFMVPDEYVELAKPLAEKAFQEGPKLFGITIMDGSSKSGQNWFETH